MRILLRAPNWIGDAVMAVPAIRSLLRSFPDARVTVVASPAVRDLYARTLPITDLRVEPRGRGARFAFLRFAAGLRRQSFDLGIAFPASFSSALLLRLANARQRIGYDTERRGFLLTRAVKVERTAGRHLARQFEALVREAGAQIHDPEVLLAVRDEDDQAAESVLRAAGIDPDAPFVALAPGATYGPAKQWPVERFGELAWEVAFRYEWPVVVLGSAAERPVGERVVRSGGKGVVNLAGRTSLGELTGVLRRAALLVTNDSGPMHVAAGVGTKVVALFGSTDPYWTAPLGEGHRVIYHAVSCSPCLQRTCSIGRVCLTSISLDEVLSQVKEMLFVTHRAAPVRELVRPQFTTPKPEEEEESHPPKPFRIVKRDAG